MSLARHVNAPNLLVATRLIGSVVLLPLGWYQYPTLLVIWAVFLALTDWLDGKLAIWLDQQSDIGARLDTIADVCMYVCLAIAVCWIKPGFLSDHLVLILTVIASYLLSVAASLARFRKPPSYHTRSAKTCWLLIAIGVVCAVLDLASWPLVGALVAVILTNLEATAITFILPQQRADVPSAYHALRMARRDQPSNQTDNTVPATSHEKS